MVNLIVDDVHFSYRSKEILKGISFSAEKGEIVGILGENGSGKTTLLNCINTEYKPKSGSILISDYFTDGIRDHINDTQCNVRDLSDSDRSMIMAIVEQNSHQSFPFTVMETVRMGRYSRTGIFDENDESELDIVCSAMESAGVLEFSDRSVSELSGGEWRRVMIAQALAQEPEMLLLDEPTLHLDVCHQFDLMDLCRKIVDEQRILIVIVTHDLQIATRYCDKVIVMDHGEVVALGKSNDVINEELIRNVFHIESRVDYDSAIDGLSVMLIGRSK